MIKIETILVPTDFSKNSLPAVRYALSLARDHGAAVIPLHILTDDTVKKRFTERYLFAPEVLYFGGKWIQRMGPPAIDDLVRERASDLYSFLQKNVEPHLLKVVKITPLVELGEVVDEIVHAARSKDCDLIVMASRGRSGMRGIFSASLTSQVVRLAPCPVLSIQPTARVKTEKGERVSVQRMELANAASL
jgi:nucleotide-binding universal stress UspA family protein